MRWPIRNQIFVPFAAILVVAVAIIAVSAASLAARRSERETREQLRRVVDTLGQASFPYTSNVLEQMRGLSGADFVALDAEGRIVASTLSAGVEPREIARTVPVARDVESLAQDPSVQFAETRYFAARVPANRSAGATSLLVLYPEQRWNEVRWEAARPPLAIGGGTLLLMLAVSAWLSRRLGRRIRAVRELFARIAAGTFDHAAAAPPRDELHELVLSANQLSDQLREMQQTIRHTERIRLLAQLAGGLAHQLRNAVTGARLAVQLHQKRCAPREDSLTVALRQLTLTEEHVKRLLALGRGEQQPSVQGTLCDLLGNVEQLVGPACRHARVRWSSSVPAEMSGVVLDGCEQLRTALLNLALNGIEAAGSGGEVRVQAALQEDAVRIEVCDSGSGPPVELRDALFDPFVTSKPEGVGLGLALARQAAESQGGSLTWRRRDELTVFTLAVPVSRILNGPALRDPSAGNALSGVPRMPDRMGTPGDSAERHGGRSLQCFQPENQ